MAVEEEVDAVLVHEGLHHDPHLLVLLEGGVRRVQGVVVAGNHPAQRHRVRVSVAQALTSGEATSFQHLPSSCGPPGMCV